MCISRSRTEISLPSFSMQTHLPGYPWRLVKMWGCMLASSYCSRKASTLKCQSVYVTLAPGSVDLRLAYQILWVPAVSSPYSLWSPCIYASGLQSHSQWSIHQSPVPLFLGRRGRTPPANCSALGLWWPSMWSCCPCMGGEPSLGHLFHPRGSSNLLWCTSNQLA